MRGRLMRRHNGSRLAIITSADSRNAQRTLGAATIGVAALGSAATTTVGISPYLLTASRISSDALTVLWILALAALALAPVHCA